MLARMTDVGIEIKFSGFDDKIVSFALSAVNALFDASQMHKVCSFGYSDMISTTLDNNTHSKTESLKVQRESLERQLTNSALKVGSHAPLLRRKVRPPTYSIVEARRVNVEEFVLLLSTSSKAKQVHNARKK